MKTQKKSKIPGLAEIIAIKLKRYREDAGLTQKELGLKLGYIEARIGDDIIAKWKEDVTFKRLRKIDGTILLSPLNPSHSDIIVTGKDLKSYKTIGVVEGSFRKRRRK